MSEKSKSFVTSETRHHFVNTSWPEWQDSDLNEEKWDAPKNGPDGLFLDVERVRMPQSIEPSRWTRAKDLEHLTGPLTVHATSVEHLDLIANNKHLLHSEFVRSFISALTNLRYCGREGLEISGEGPNFVWNSRSKSWHGWLHVYSLNKAGRTAQHRPVINPNGKYVIRLHCMGCWRRIVVDDTIPVDKNGLPLLPRTSNTELWPMLLAKAMLKIASLSWTHHREIIDFHPISCLTGWTCLALNIAHLSLKDKWDFLTRYVERFEWTQQAAGDRVSESTKNDANDNTVKIDGNQQSFPKIERPQPVRLLLYLRGAEELGNDAVPGLSPSWYHAILVLQSRDIPLDPKDAKPSLEKWKLHRWLNWAISQNIINPADYFVPIRFLKVISPLREYDDNLTYIHVEAEKGSIFLNEIKQLNKVEKSANSLARKGDSTDDIDQWIDFNKMAPYVTEVHLFYKREDFWCSIQITNDTIKMINGDHKIAAKEKREEKEDNTNRKLQMSRHKFKYLFCDSPKKKFFLITLCASQKEKDADSCKRSYLILEEHNWFSLPIKTDHSVTISTTGNKSTIIELEAGTQLLRIHSSSEFLAIISSDTVFHFGNRITVQQLMTAESIRIEQLSKTISDHLCKAYQSFGTKDYPVALKKYYRSYTPTLPNNTLKKNKKLRMQIHHFFMEEQVRLIDETFPDVEAKNILRSLRIFFLDPNIRIEHFDLAKTQSVIQHPAAEEIAEETPYSRLASSPEKILECDQAATIIQSFFRMTLVKIYKQLHNSEHAENTSIREKLLKISDLFDLSVTSRLLRNVIKRHSSLYDLYPCSQDFVHVLNFHDFNGILNNINNEQWFPIARFVVNPKPSEKILAFFELLIDLPRFALRVFRNDNRREMKHVINHVAPDYYEYCSTGYTVFAYGWSDKRHFKDIDWTIRVITAKGQSIFRQLDEKFTSSLSIKLPDLTVKESTVTYTPNVKNCISRWILRATSGTLVSIRLSTSYHKVEVKIKVTDEEGNVLANINGGSTILLVSMILGRPDQNETKYETEDGGRKMNGKFKSTKEKKEYYIEAFVLNDSWPLTDSEWTIVNQRRMKNIDLETKMNLENKDDQVFESPHCILQVIINTNNAIEIFQDKRREQEAALLKESWRLEDQSRPERGRQLRESFLNEYATKIVTETSSEHIENQLEIIEDADAVFCLPHEKERRTLKPPKTHHLPTLDLTKYVQADEYVRDRRVKTESEYKLLWDQLAASIIDSQKKHSDYLEKLTRLENEQFRNYAKLFAKKKANFLESRALVDDAYEEMRKAYVDASKSAKANVENIDERRN